MPAWDRWPRTGPGALSSWELLRDKARRITRRTEVLNGRTAVYDHGYDAAGRLATVHLDGRLVEEYHYDENGRRVREHNALRDIAGRAYEYSIEDHLVSTGQTSFRYDLDGFLLYRDDGGTRTLYDFASRGELLSVSLPDGRLIEYVYDPLGRRIAKKIDGALTEKYLWQGLTRLLAVYDANDRLQLRFEYADGRLPVAMTGENGARSHLFYDPVGSLRLVVNGQGNVVKEIQYDAFGSILSDSNPGLHIPLGFAGGLHDPDTALVRFGFRDYDPATGRWTAKDPIGFVGGDTDLYGYSLNDPINRIDPHGLIIGSILSNGIGKIVGQTAQEAALSGKIADAAISAVFTFDTNNTVVPKVNSQVVVNVLLGIQGWGTFQTVSLGCLSAASAPAWLPVGLSSLAGLEIGGLFNAIYECISGQSLGEDIYDWINLQQLKDFPCE